MISVMLAQAAALFTAPGLAIAGAAAVSIPIAIHLLSRTRRRTEQWGAMRFLLQAYRQHKRRVLLEQWLLLLLRCLIFALLGLALSGPLVAGVASWLGGAGNSGRVVELVVDTSLSTQAKTPAASAHDRFDKLRRAGLSVIAALGRRDRAALWRAGRPAAAIIADPTQDHAKVAKALRALKPGDARPDLPAALAAVAARLKASQVAPSRAVVIVLSDFSRSAGYLNLAMSDQTAALGRRAKIVVAHPAIGRGNIQLARLAPRRRLVVTDRAGRVRTLVEVVAQRFGQSSAEGTGLLTLRLLDSRGQSLATAQRPIHWAAGQSKQTLNVALHAKLSNQAWAGSKQARLVVQGTVATDRGADALTADDHRWAVLTARKQLRIAMADAGGRTVGKEPSASQWMSLALWPGAGPIRVSNMLAAQLDRDALKNLDAVVVVRPDLLNQRGWAALNRFARRGGLVWVTVPAAASAASWVEPMEQAFSLDWRIALEPTSTKNPHGAALDPSTAVPKPLMLLASDFKSLLSPVRVTKRLAMSVPSSDDWLSLTGAAAKGGHCLLAGQPIGAGELVFLAAAVSPGWTNLETKPLFVPLVQETVRGVLGRAHRGETDIVCGDKLSLGPTWAGAAQLRRAPWSALPASSSNAAGRLIHLSAKDQTVASRQAVTAPGVYRASQGGRQLAVNVDPAGGDTRAVRSAALGRWLDGFGRGRWSYLNWSDPGAAVKQTIKRTNLAWPLLWAVLALVLVETILARVFSHAQRLGEAGLLDRATRRLRPGRAKRPRAGRAA